MNLLLKESITHDEYVKFFQAFDNFFSFSSGEKVDIKGWGKTVGLSFPIQANRCWCNYQCWTMRSTV